VRLEKLFQFAVELSEFFAGALPVGIQAIQQLVESRFG
jgi:hypothetical protein